MYASFEKNEPECEDVQQAMRQHTVYPGRGRFDLIGAALQCTATMKDGHLSSAMLLRGHSEVMFKYVVVHLNRITLPESLRNFLCEA